jgi:hypothetical protein
MAGAMRGGCREVIDAPDHSAAAAQRTPSAPHLTIQRNKCGCDAAHSKGQVLPTPA